MRSLDYYSFSPSIHAVSVDKRRKSRNSSRNSFGKQTDNSVNIIIHDNPKSVNHSSGVRRVTTTHTNSNPYVFYAVVAIFFLILIATIAVFFASSEKDLYYLGIPNPFDD